LAPLADDVEFWRYSGGCPITSQYVIRNYRAGDFDSYVELHVDAERADKAGHRTSTRLLGEILGRPDYSPEDDIFVAEAGGEVIGCLNLTPELGIGRVVLECLVHPEHRRRSLATRLYSSAVSRASDLGARVVQAAVPEDNIAARSLASRLGFTFARRFLELTLKLPETQLPGVGQVAPGCRPLRRGEEGTLAEIQNRSFAGTWGYHSCTVEEVAYRAGMSDCYPGGIVLISEADQPAGYCWTTIDTAGNTGTQPSKGRIHMLGVLPEHRGKRLGKRVLLAGLSCLEARDIELAEITVDSENIEACALYESVGFKTHSTTEWYEKALD
jgi:mycothiol synthase